MMILCPRIRADDLASWNEQRKW